MIKILKENSKQSEDFQKVEKLLDSLGIQIHTSYGRITVKFDSVPDTEFVIKDRESGDFGLDLPRVVDSEVFILEE